MMPLHFSASQGVDWYKKKINASIMVRSYVCHLRKKKMERTWFLVPLHGFGV